MSILKRIIIVLVWMTPAMTNMITGQAARASSEMDQPAAPLSENVSDSLLYRQYISKMVAYEQADIDSVMHYLNEALVVARRNIKRMEELRLLRYAAYNLSNAGRFAESLNHYQLAFELAEDPAIEQHFWSILEGFTASEERLFQLSNMHFTFGHLMMITGDKEGRRYHYQKSREIAQNNNDLRNMAYAESGLAMIYLELGEVDVAQEYIKSCLETMHQLDARLNMPFANWIQGNIYMHTRQFDSAYASYLAGLKYGDEESNRPGYTMNNLGLSQYFQAINDPDSSLYYAHRTYDGPDMQAFQALNFDVALALENLYSVFELRNQPDSMLKYLQMAKAARDSLNWLRIDHLQAFQMVLMEQQAEQKELEKQRMKAQARSRFVVLLFILFLVIAVTIILYRSYKQKQRSNRELSATIDELKKTQAQLIQSEKMASLGELTAGIAHEIQNPLNFVNNFSDVSAEMIDEIREELQKLAAYDVGANNFSPAEHMFNTLTDIKQNLEKIHHHGRRADSIVKGMLMHSRTSTGQKEPTDINALADEYLRLAYHGLRAKDKSFNATFVTDFDDTIPRIEIAPQDMGRVLLNLINNAFHAVYEKSTSMTGTPVRANNYSPSNDSALQNEPASQPQYTPTVTITTKNLGDRIEIAVKDNGPGIPESISNKIFQPFFTTKPAGQGTGLGLSLSYDIVKAHGGEIGIESSGKEGTAFLITLPTA